MVRPKTVALALSLLPLLALMSVRLRMRGDPKIVVLPDRNPIAVTLSHGRTRNGYAVRLYNKTGRERSFALAVSGL